MVSPSEQLADVQERQHAEDGEDDGRDAVDVESQRKLGHFWGGSH